MRLLVAVLSRIWRSAVSVVAISLLVAGWLPQASAGFHLMMVREVYGGGPDQTQAQFVELQMWSSSQNLVSGRRVAVYDSQGAEIASFTFPANVPNGANQASILIATTQAQTYFGVTADLVMTPSIPSAGGKVCFMSGTSPIDCVSWGNYAGPSAGTGTPFGASEGLLPGASIERKIDRGNPTVLDFLDDTGDSAADFRYAGPSPRNNAGATGVACCLTGFAATLYKVEEVAPSVTVTVSRNVTDSESSINHSTADGTAVAGADYTSVSGTLVFAAGEASKTISIPILQDAVDELDETFSVRLRGLTSGVYSKIETTVVIIGTIQPPDPPANPAAVAGPGNGQITVSWSPPPNTNGAPVGKYRVYVGTNSVSFSLLAEVASDQLQYVHSGLGSYVERFYRISAVNIAGEGLPSDVVSAVTFVSEPPSAPVNLRVQHTPVGVGNVGNVRLVWANPAKPNGVITSYRVYRGTVTEARTFLAEVSGITAYTDTTCGLSTICFYTVTAVNGAGEGPHSNEVFAPGTRV